MKAENLPSDEWIRCIKAGFPFVLFRSPGNDHCETWVQSSEFLNSFHDFKMLPDSKGFVFAPFNISEKNPILFLRPDHVSQNIRQLPDLLFDTLLGSGSPVNELPFKEIDRKGYLQNLENLIERLKAGEAEKVVISRAIGAKCIHAQDLVKIFEDLCRTYPHAFVYLARLTNHEIWMGASPETLISCAGNHCKTMSLAGSRTLGSHEKWGDKEQEEQRIVTRYIKEKILMHRVQNLRTSEPFTKPAGQVEHLCTDFEFDLCNRRDLAGMVKELHPTPAVCGIPLAQAKQLISEFEMHEREYYSGYLGPVNYDNKTELFVNLRCMKLLKNNTLLFVGGGITQDSVPEKEWEETILKSRTLLSVIEKCRI